MQTIFRFILGFLTLFLVSTSSLAATNAIAAGQITNGTISASGEINWYSFSASSNDFVTITICRTNGVGRPYFELYNSDGFIAAAMYGGSVALLEGQPLPATGTYTLMVREVALNQTLGYELSFIKLRCGTNLREAGDAPETIQPGQFTGGHIDSVADLDTYCFDAVSNELVTITLFRTNGAGLPYFQLYNSDGYLAESPFGNPLEFVEDLRLPKTGPYTLWIRDVSLTQTFGYQLGVTKLRCGVNLREAGDAPETIQPGEIAGGHIDSVADLDTYCFDAVANELVTISIFRTNGAGLPYFQLYNSDGLIAESPFGNPLEFVEDLRLSRTGPYTLMLRDVSLTQTVGYAFTFAKIPVSSPVLQSNEKQSGTIGLGEMDAYSFYAIAGNSITLRLDKTSGPGQTYMRAYGPGPTFLKDGYQRIQLTCLDETGYYTVLVRDVGANEPLAYDLSMIQTPIVPPSNGLTQYLAILACSTNIIVRWHTNSTGFVLESSPKVTSPPDHPPAVWSPVATPPQIVTDYFYVNEASVPDQARFYRLKCTNCVPGP